MIINRIELEKTAKDKIPQLFSNDAIFDRRSLEQCTSEDIAEYKSTLIKGKKLLVLAAGLGVDEIAFSKNFDKVISIELNEELNLISSFNFNNLQLFNIDRKTDSAENFISNNKDQFDWIYTDPDRRDEKGRQILLKDHQPDIVSLQSNLFEFTDQIAIKASPLYDFEMALKELASVTELYAISRRGEMKELLIICSKKKLEYKQVQLHSVDVSDNIKLFSCGLNSGSVPVKGDLNFNYFYEAGNSLIKMRTHHQYAFEKKLNLIDVSVPYYLSNELSDEFLGRVFKLEKSFNFNTKQFKQYLFEKGISKLNLKVRGLKFSTSEILKNLKIKEGGEDYIFLLPFNGQATVFHCKKN